MNDGLKQGCPLAPLLFILVIDPLLHLLADLDGVEPKCFADDLAVGFREWKDICSVFPMVDAWSRAAGLKPNASKTKFVTTSDGEVDLAQILPAGWPG
jgi:hypothetical protein